VVEQAAAARRRRRPGPGRGVEAAGRRRPGRGGDLPARVQEGAGARAGGRLRRDERRRREAGQGRRHQVGAVQEGHPAPRQLRRPRRPRRVRREARHHAPHRSSAEVAGKRDYAAVTVILAAAATGETPSSRLS
jgi:hypothetical protein